MNISSRKATIIAYNGKHVECEQLFDGETLLGYLVEGEDHATVHGGVRDPEVDDAGRTWQGYFALGFCEPIHQAEFMRRTIAERYYENQK